MTPDQDAARRAAEELWARIEIYAHEPWSTNDPGFAIDRLMSFADKARREERERLRPCIESAMLWFKEHGYPELSWQYETALRHHPDGAAGEE